MSDRITLLRCHDSLVLAKRIEPDGEGWKVTPYDSTASYAWSQREVSSVDDIHGVLADIASDPRVCVIRGEPMEHVKPGAIVNRRANVGADGEGPDWEEARPGRRWVAFDFDNAELPDLHCRLEDWGATAADFLKARLPYQFRNARAVFKLSSSAALNGLWRVSMHLWFWLDRPVCNMSWRAWMKANGIDASFFTPVQPHFTADPVFVGVDDPLKGCRMGILPGAAVVTVPPELMDLDEWEAEQDRQRAARPKPERVNVPDGRRRSAQEKYALAALQSAVDEIQSAGEGGRHDAAFRQAHSIGGYVGAGVLDWGLARDALTDAICSVVPANRHAKEAASVAEGIELGFKKPRDMSRIGTKAGGAERPKLSVVQGDKPMTQGGAALDIEAYDMGGDEVERALAKESARKRKIESGAFPDYPDLGSKDKVLTTSPNLSALLASMGLRPWRNLMDHNTEWDRPKGAPNIPRECLQAVMEADVLDAATRTGWALSKDNFWGRVSAIEAANAVHPVAEWVASKPWDGVSRLDDLFSTLIFAEEHQRFGDLLRMQFRKWLVAGGKCLTADHNSAKGIDVQGVLVLQGPQDIGKTRWFKSLVPDSSWIAEGVTMDPSNKDSVIEATSSFIVELGELDATTRKADVAMLKSFLTRDVDEYRSPYGRKREAYPRRTLYGATVNPSEFLVDQTGNRRYWMMPCADIIHPDHIDMQQLWAEACVLAKSEGHWMIRRISLFRSFILRYRVCRILSGSSFPEQHWS